MSGTSASVEPLGDREEHLSAPISAFPAGRSLEIVAPRDKLHPSHETPLTTASLPAIDRKFDSALKFSNDELFRAVSKTLPLDVELLRPLRYRVPMNGGTFDILILTLAVPPAKEEGLERWRAKFQAEHAVTVLIERSRTFSGVRSQLNSWTEGSDLLTAAHLPRLERYLKGFFGKPPLPPSDLKLPTDLRDLSSEPFVAIDPDGTLSCEDLLYAEPGSRPGSIRLKVAFIDVTHFVRPGGNIDRYAGRIGSSIFGSRTYISTLGPGIANGPASFLPGELRPSWLVEVELSPEGDILERSVSRALVKSHLQIAPQAFNLSETNGELGRCLHYLKEATERIRAKRVKQKKIILVEREGLGGEIVGESMVAAKSALAHFMLDHNIPAIFRTHTPPTPERKRELAKDAQILGLDASEEHFDEPVQFAALLQKLESYYPSPRARELLQEILDVFFTRSRFDTVNRGHFGIGVDAYIEIKPRDAAGLINQYQLYYFFSRSAAHFLSLRELERRCARRNRQTRERGAIEYKLRFYERLRENLGLCGRNFDGFIREIHPDRLLIDVSGFTKWGVIPVPSDGQRNFQFLVDSTVRAGLKGFSPEYMRFLFLLLESHEGRARTTTRNP